jgi:hypothetical protein
LTHYRQTQLANSVATQAGNSGSNLYQSIKGDIKPGTATTMKFNSFSAVSNGFYAPGLT